MKLLRLLLDLIFVTRPVVLIPVIGFSLFGYRLAAGDDSLWQTFSWTVLAKLVVFTLSVAAVYVVNQLEDYDVDSDNEGYPLLVKSGISKSLATLFTFLLALASLLLPLLWQDFMLMLFSGLTLLLGYLYCFKPFYFTGRPFLDFLSNGLGYGLIAFLAGWNCAKSIQIDAFEAAIPFITMMFAGSISSTLPDIEGDAKHDKRTTAVVFGKVNAHLLATLFLIVTGILGIIQSEIVALCSALAAIPVYIVYLIKPSQAIMEATYKVGGGISMLIIGLFYPQFILLGTVIAVVTVLYFRIFHNVMYPSLLPIENSN